MKFGNEVNKILKRLKNGEKCFEELYNLTYKHLLVVAKLYLKDKSMADDVLSEAFIAVYKNIHSFNQEKNGYNWLCKIVQNKAYNINNATFDYYKLDCGKASETDSLDEYIMSFDVGIALSKLSRNERELIILRFFENKTLQEIATLKKVSVTMIHKTIKKILKKIEKLL